MKAEHGSGASMNDKWITDEDVADPKPLPKMLGWRALVRPVSAKRKTKGGIILPDSTRDDIAYLTTVGRVLAIGPLAFSRTDMLEPMVEASGNIIGHTYNPWFKVGDYITYGKFAGIKRIYKGVKLLIINDDEAIDVIENPHDIDTTYNLSSGEK